MTAACQDEIQKNTEKEEKLKAKHVAAEEKEKKRLARAAAKEEKLKGREKKTEPSTADAAESEPRPAKKQRRSRVEVKPAEKPEEKLEKPEEKFEEKPEEKLEEKPADDAKRDRKAEKVKEAFCLITDRVRKSPKLHSETTSWCKGCCPIDDWSPSDYPIILRHQEHS